MTCPPGCTRATTAARRARVAELTLAGATTALIASQLGVTERTVTRDRVATGVAQPHPMPAPLTPAEVARIEVMLADGCPLTEIAATLRVNPKRLLKRWAGKGWTRTQTGTHAQTCRMWKQVPA